MMVVTNQLSPIPLKQQRRIDLELKHLSRLAPAITALSLHCNAADPQVSLFGYHDRTLGEELDNIS